MGFWSELKLKPRSSGKSSPSCLATGTQAPQSTLPATGFFPNAQSFEIRGGQFLDASSTTLTTTNVYNVNQSGLDLVRQNMAPSAIHNSADRFDAPKCDEDTRIGVIEEIMGWIKGDTASPTQILCMTGPAGTGKSAVEQTIAEMCESESILAASFFFSASDSSRNNKNALVATIAYQIAQSVPHARAYIAEAAWEDPTIFYKSLGTQLQVLIVRPLRRAAESRRRCGEDLSKPLPHAILIDGLDECHGTDHQAHILRALHNSLLDCGLHFRIFIASRSEYAIRNALDGHLCNIAYHIVLDDKYNPDGDIRLYLQRRLTDIGRKSSTRVIGIETWPKAADITQLVENASGQFIYAATVIKFVSQRHFSPSERLQLLLTWTPDKHGSKNPFAMLDTLYHSILSLAQDAIKDEVDDPLSTVRLLNRIRFVQKCFGGNHSSISFMEQFPFLHRGEIIRTLTDLHALVKLSDGDISFHHKSFTDFLDHPSRSGKYYISKESIYTELVVILDKHIFHDPKGISFCFNASMAMYSQHILWLTILRHSSQDDQVLHILKAFDFEQCSMNQIPLLGIEFYSVLSYQLHHVYNAIRAKHATSGEWLRICNHLRSAEDKICQRLQILRNDEALMSLPTPSCTDTVTCTGFHTD